MEYEKLLNLLLEAVRARVGGPSVMWFIGYGGEVQENNELLRVLFNNQLMERGNGAVCVLTELGLRLVNGLVEQEQEEGIESLRCVFDAIHQGSSPQDAVRAVFG